MGPRDQSREIEITKRREQSGGYRYPKGQIRIPAELMTKSWIPGGRIQVVEASEGLMLKPIPRMEDWAGADAGKYSYAKMVKELDNLRKRWR